MSATVTLDAPGGTEQVTGPVRRHTVVPTDLGDLTVVADGDTLVGVYFPEHQPAPPASVFGALVDPGEVDDPLLTEAAAQLVDYVAGRRPDFDVPFRASGSERARQVWDLISAVPRGGTTSYAALGRAVGVGPRAAGQFVARNPLSVLVPCHRVVASDGRLTGYAGGVDRKRTLLELEGALPVGSAAVPRSGGAGPASAAADPTGERAAEEVDASEAGEVSEAGEASAAVQEVRDVAALEGERAEVSG